MAVLGVGLLRVSVPPSQDPGYQAPAGFVAGCLVVVIAVVTLALVAVPRPRPSAAAAAPPRLLVLSGASALTTLVFFGLSFPVFGQQQPAFTRGMAVLAPMAVTAVITAASYLFLTRAAAGPAWTQRHTLALVGGALVAHSVGGLVVVAHTSVDRIGLIAIIVLTLLGIGLLDRRLRHQSADPA